MSAHRQTVLFDAPGPRARRRILIANVVGILLVAAILAVVLIRFAEQGQLDAGKWSPFLQADTWLNFMLPGLMATLRAAAVAIVTSVVFGFLFGVGRLSHLAPLRWFCSIVVEFFRAVPVLLMMIFLWIGLANVRIFPPQDVPFIAVVTALTLYNGAVIAELVRSGVHSLPKGQREAALAIGMTRQQSLRNVEIPQALVAMLPALLSQFVVILKDSALGAIITYVELLNEGRRLGSAEGNMVPALLVTALIFIVINFALTALAHRLSRYLSSRTASRTAQVSPTPNLLPGEDTAEPAKRP
ncbi:amino acid ABC transporter permease [Arthrobacter mobilis]|uniref:Amino acid ABC transporter permease n=1 Tax=Arthrobacter mobilis TaxID=2724944 RepID=A0A7X6HAZ6_9MICC|nr:amino acid ABC transporter permease [Arthrobacter mobilis]NKX53749.1 amino acid ABC transporter permease [Arthrobacter mobilis]